MGALVPRPGRPPTRDPQKIQEWYAARGLKPPTDVLTRAIQLQAKPAARNLPSVRNAPQRSGDSSRDIPPTPIRAEDPNETEQQIVARIDKRFELVMDFTTAALEGDLTSMVVSGAPGVGKSHNIKRILLAAREERDKQNNGHSIEFVSGGKITPINLYKALWRTRNPGSVLLLDDADGVWWKEDSLSILKGALDSVPDRQISWMSEAATLKEEDIPQTFVFRGAVIFISNIDFQTYVDTTRSNITDHLRAVMNRTQYIDLKLHTNRELVAWIGHIVLKTHMLVAAGLTRDQERDVVEYIKSNKDKLRDLSLRTAMKCITYIKRAAKRGENWRESADMILLR